MPTFTKETISSGWPQYLPSWTPPRPISGSPHPYYWSICGYSTMVATTDGSPVPDEPISKSYSIRTHLDHKLPPTSCVGDLGSPYTINAPWFEYSASPDHTQYIYAPVGQYGVYDQGDDAKRPVQVKEWDFYTGGSNCGSAAVVVSQQWWTGVKTEHVRTVFNAGGAYWYGLKYTFS